jgi:hypothetical protein
MPWEYRLKTVKTEFCKHKIMRTISLVPFIIAPQHPSDAMMPRGFFSLESIEVVLNGRCDGSSRDVASAE